MVVSTAKKFILKSFCNVTGLILRLYDKILMLSLKKGYSSFLHHIRETEVRECC